MLRASEADKQEEERDERKQWREEHRSDEFRQRARAAEAPA